MIFVKYFIMYLLKIILFGNQHQIAKRLVELRHLIIIEPITMNSFSILSLEMDKLLEGPLLLFLQIIICVVDSGEVEVEFGLWKNFSERGVPEEKGVFGQVFSNCRRETRWKPSS